MSSADRVSRPARFPLATRAARTPDAAALLFRGDVETPSRISFASRGASGVAVQPTVLSGTGTGSILAVSFRDLDRLTAVAARELRARGVFPGERVALRLPAGPAYPVLLLSLLRAGAVAVPLSTRLPGAAVPALLERIGCRRMIADLTVQPAAAARVAIIDAGVLLAAREEPPGGPLPPFERSSDATIVFTSGSTGTPKAALHRFENHWASAAGANRNVRLRPGDRCLLSLPPWHVGGLAVIFRCLLGGAAIAIAGTGEPLADAIAGLGATHVSLVATQLHRLLNEESGRAALRSLKAVLLGGGPAPAALIDEALRAGVRLVTSYGLTEMSSQATATRPSDRRGALETAGTPLLFRELSVAADGEIMVRGRTLFRGYVDEKGILPARDSAGWFHTGDLGRLDTEGRLVVTGRRDSMFISGGENIHPEEIEREIMRFPGVLEAIVAPVPDPEFGARPVAFLRVAVETVPAAAALEQFLRSTLPGFKIPVRYLPWPQGEEGMKPDRRSFAARAAAGAPEPPPKLSTEG